MSTKKECTSVKLSKKECAIAMAKWEKARSNYDEIKTLVDPGASFNFCQEDCEWIEKKNKNSVFVTSIGIDEEETLILIVKPLDKDGQELDLDKYLASPLTKLTEDLTFVETDVVTTTKTTILSNDLEVTSYIEEIDYPTYNKPTMIERASVQNIVLWKTECFNWFYKECKQTKGENIFMKFVVPFSDLSMNTGEYNEIKALFALKFSATYQEVLPTLIFVSSEEDFENESASCQIFRAGGSIGLDTNVTDYSSPVPPFGE